MIDFVDVGEGTVVASARLDRYIVAVLGDQLAAAYRQSERGVPYVDILSISMTGR